MTSSIVQEQISCTLGCSRTSDKNRISRAFKNHQACKTDDSDVELGETLEAVAAVAVDDARVHVDSVACRVRHPDLHVVHRGQGQRG